MSVFSLLQNRTLIIAILLGCILPTTLSAISGNISIPHNDAWAYSRIAKNYAITGEIELLGWNRASLVGQFLPFENLFSSIVIQHLVVAVFSLVLLLSVYFLLLEYLPTRKASIGVLAISIWPGFALLSTSFMGDVPAMATTFFALYLAQRGLKKKSKFFIVLALLISFWSFTMREQALAAAVAILIWTYIDNRKKRFLPVSFIAFISSLLLSSMVLFQIWRMGLANTDSASFELRSNGFQVAASGLVRAYFEFALVLVPSAIVAGVKFKLSRSRIVLASFVTTIGFFQLFYAGTSEFFLPNYLSISGAYSSVLPFPIAIFPESIWYIVIMISIGLGAIAMFILPEKFPKLNLLAIFSVLVLAGTLIQFFIDQGVFGRYLIPIAPFIFLLLIQRESRCEIRTEKNYIRKLSLTHLILVSFLSLGLLANSFAFDRMRWSTATDLTQAGLKPMQIDAGLEWLGWHSPSGVVSEVRKGEDPEKYWGFNVLFANKPCFVLTQSDKFPIQYADLTKDWRLVKEIQFSTFLLFGKRSMYLFETFSAECPSSQTLALVK